MQLTASEGLGRRGSPGAREQDWSGRWPPLVAGRVTRRPRPAGPGLMVSQAPRAAPGLTLLLGAQQLLSAVPGAEGSSGRSGARPAGPVMDPACPPAGQALLGDAATRGRGPSCLLSSRRLRQALLVYFSSLRESWCFLSVRRASVPLTLNIYHSFKK